MKIGVYLKSYVDPSIGGNFSYYKKLIKAIDDHTFDNAIEICFIGRFSKSRFKKKYHKLAPTFVRKCARAFQKLKITNIFLNIFGISIDFCSKWDAKILRANNVDLILFPSQFLKEVDNFPFITMNWDAGHKTTFAFPELLENFRIREQWYRDDIQQALSVFVESESGKQEFSKYYSIPPEKIEVIPLFAGGVVDLTVDADAQEKILTSLALLPQQYFYYPAQFWAHKNHYNLIRAFRNVVGTDRNVKLVLTGSDMGTKDYIVSLIRSEKLEQHVLVLGFVSNEEVYTFYKNSIALVMPTFLGPTNMPLLEAQALGVPVICSDLNGHREQCRDAALYADPLAPDQWSKAMISLLDADVRKSLLTKSQQVLKTSPFTIENALRSLEISLIKISSIRKTFR